MAKTKPTKKSQQDFYEMMPGAFMDSYEMFPTRGRAADDVEHYDVQEEELSPEQARARMVQQGLILVALLIVQIILFAILIKSTVNLG